MLERFSKDTLKIIQESKEDQWLPVEYDIELTNLVGEEIGEEGLMAWNRKSFEQSLESSMVGPFFRAALNLFKIKPNSVLKLCPYLWKSICRNNGKLSVINKGHNCVHIVIEDIPLVMIQSRAYFLGLAASIQSILSYTKVIGKVELKDQSKETQRAVILVTWDAD